MFNKKSLCLLGIAAMLALPACSGDTPEGETYTSDGENIVNGNTSIILDEDEGQKAELTRPPEAARVTIDVGLVKNDVGAAALASLAEENEADESFEMYNIVYADNYTALASMMKDGTVGVGILSPSEALDMYAADKSVKVLASIAGKSYKLIGEGISSLSDLSGKTVYISNDDKTSLCLMTKLTAYAGVTDCTLEYAEDNAALTDMIKSGTAKYALLPETYITLLEQEGIVINEYDFAQDWENATEGNSYSSSCIVATNEFLTTQNAAVDYMLADMERSVEAVKSDTSSCAQAAVKYGLADDAKAVEAAYSGMDCEFYKDKQMRYLINNMFTAFDNADSDILGTDVPDEEFYLVKE